MSLLVVGTVAFDSIETPFGKTDKTVGGAAMYICHAAACKYNDIYLVSAVGDDFPQEEIARLHSKGINTEGMQISKGEKTFYWSGKYTNDMNSRDTLATELNVLANFHPLLPEPTKFADFVLLGSQVPSIQLEALNQLQSKPKLIVVDTMNYWLETGMKEFVQVLKQTNVLVLNDEEARLLSGENSLIKAAKQILTMGPESIIIKKGEHGALLFNMEGKQFYAPALPLEQVIDPTGAGDSFAGGFISYLAASNDTSFSNMKRALVYASALASFTIEGFGTKKLNNVSQEDVEKRTQKLLSLVQCDYDLVTID